MEERGGATERIVLLVAPTGGAMEAMALLERLAPDFPAPVLMALHLPSPMVKAIAVTAARRARLPISLAEPGIRPQEGRVYLCPGDLHMGLAPDKSIILSKTPENTLHRPSLDILLHTGALRYRAGVIAIFVSGFDTDADGADGARSVAQAGGRVIVQTAPGLSPTLGAAEKIGDLGLGATHCAAEEIPGILSADL